jgi:quercetin dioxygenase-like cupin family protein
MKRRRRCFQSRHTSGRHKFAYIIKGGLELQIEGRPTRALKLGDGFQVPPNTPHAGGENASQPSAGVVIESSQVPSISKFIAAPRKPASREQRRRA